MPREEAEYGGRKRRADTARRMAVAFAISISLHGLALPWLDGLRTAAETPAPLLRVSLIAGGGGPGGEPRTGSAPPSAAPPASVPHAPAPAPAAAPPKRVAERRVVKKPATTAKPSRPHVAQRHSAPAQAAPAPVAAAGVEHARGGDTGSAGEAPAANPGPGAGGGTGGGVGRGSGTGTGDDAGPGSAGAGDLRLACLHCPAPSYPRRAVARGVEGVVSVQFALAADGSVERAWIRRSSGDHDLDRAALAVARRSRFRSARSRSTGGAQGYLDYRFQLARRAASR